jgi:hypothetical protein
MKHAICVALCVAYASGVGAQSEEAAATAPSSAGPASETKYMLLHKEGDPRFITSIQRLGRCEVPGDAHSGMRIPWQGDLSRLALGESAIDGAGWKQNGNMEPQKTRIIVPHDRSQLID